MPKRSSVSLLIVAAVLAVAVYMYTRQREGFTDASGNPIGQPIEIPMWGKAVIGIAVVGFIFLMIWSFVLQTKGTYSALSGVGSGIANAGKGVRNWGASLLGKKSNAN